MFSSGLFLFLPININMAFNPKSESFSFNPSDPTAIGTNSVGDSLYDCSRKIDKDRTKAYWEDLNRQYGINVKYWAHGYDLKEHDALYGEHTTSKFKGPRDIKLLINLENQNTILSKFGIITDTDIQFYIPIAEFDRVWGVDAVPNRGDLIELTIEACDRPERQSPKVFEVTNKKDSVDPIDVFAGHYVWFLEAKRFDYSYENGAPDEGGEPITNSTFVGLMSGGVQEKSAPVSYGPSADEEAVEDLNNTSNSGTYGGYI
jgi:hypothetical protein